MSPCVAKRREFDETGHSDYNVAIQGLLEHFEDEKICLADFPEVEFDNTPAERGAPFSTPGGPKAAVEESTATMEHRISAP